MGKLHDIFSNDPGFCVMANKPEPRHWLNAMMQRERKPGAYVFTVSEDSGVEYFGLAYYKKRFNKDGGALQIIVKKFNFESLTEIFGDDLSPQRISDSFKTAFMVDIETLTKVDPYKGAVLGTSELGYKDFVKNSVLHSEQAKAVLSRLADKPNIVTVVTGYARSVHENFVKDTVIEIVGAEICNKYGFMLCTVSSVQDSPIDELIKDVVPQQILEKQSGIIDVVDTVVLTNKDRADYLNTLGLTTIGFDPNNGQHWDQAAQLFGIDMPVPAKQESPSRSSASTFPNNPPARVSFRSQSTRPESVTYINTLGDDETERLLNNDESSGCCRISCTLL